MAEFIVTLQPGADLKSVAAGCRDKGVTVVSELAELDMLVLDTTADKAATLESMPGVATVEPGHDVGIS
jgi:hypothetical protein